MRNNRTTPLFIRAYFENYTVTFEIWGVPQENDAQYEIEVVLVSETEAPPQEYVIDTAHKYVSKPGEYKVVSESRKGYFYETYQIKKVPGQEPVRTLIYTSTYNPIPAKPIISRRRGSKRIIFIARPLLTPGLIFQKQPLSLTKSAF